VSDYDENDVLTGGTLTEYGYDYEGRVSSVDVSNYDEDGVLTGGTLTEYGYDYEGRVSSVDVSNYDEDDVLTGGTATEYEYDDEGRVKSVDVYSYDGNSVITGGTATEYEYDEQGRIIKVTISTFDESDTLTNRKVTEYAYDGQGRVIEVSSQISDPVGDLYRSGGSPASGPDWQDITKVGAVCTDETITFTLTSLGWMLDEDFVDGAIMVLVDVDGDGEVVPPEGTIDFYEGNFDYGIFIPSPEFGEPPIFIDNLQLMGTGEYDTEGAQYSIDGNKIEIEVQLDHIGDPEGSIGFVAAIRTGIMSDPIEDRLPNEGLVQIPDP
jgi:YD repeat-containing protein